jgi:aldose 1-epimerase
MQGTEMASETAVTLLAGKLRVVLSPSVGGSISAVEWSDGGSRRPILRKCNSSSQNVLNAASFPLVPYVNRIRGGRFTFRTREVNIAPNMAGDISPLHGQGWLHPWRVEQATQDRAILSFRHSAGEWPWDYEALQEFALDERGLSATLACRNVDDEPMPCGLGQHPYFLCGPNTRIDTRVSHAWTIDEHVLPVEKVPAEGRYDLSDRLVCGQDLDNGFGGWAGEAAMTDPAWPYDLRLASPQARFFQVYSPPEGGIFVAEPVTQANGALNVPENQWAELGLGVLAAGEAMSLDMRLDVIAK